jgi:hypothetical protein
MVFHFNTGWYFQGAIRWAGYVLPLLAVVMVTKFTFVAISFVVVGVIILTTRYGISVDKASKQYTEYTWFLGYKNGQAKSYDQIQYLFIKNAKVSRTYNTRIHTTTITDLEFNGYLKFSEAEKIHIANADDKQKLINKLLPVANALQIRVLDYTQEPPVVIETAGTNM